MSEKYLPAEAAAVLPEEIVAADCIQELADRFPDDE